LLPPASTPAQPDSPEDPLSTYGLTEREREVLVALAGGRTNREIAEELVISDKTASVHVSNILRKLDVSGRQEAARIAHRLGVTA
jgi:DNA-binding NarL/FixJ family response regulator